MDSDEQLFDSQFLQSLRRLFARLRRRSSNLRGNHQAPAIGNSKEFKDRRSYVAGDDFRSIDWRCYARLEKLFVRLYEDIREYHVHIIIDHSRSMVAPYPAKRRVALRAAAAIAYLALENNHRVSFHGCSDSVNRLLPPMKGAGQIHRVLDFLPRLEFAEGSSVATALRHFRPRGSALVYVFSDLLDPDPDELIDSLGHFSRRNPDAWLVQVLDPQEVRTDLQGSYHLLDEERGITRQVFLGRAEMEAYERMLGEWLQALANCASDHQLGYLRWLSEDAFDERISALIDQGQALARRS